jgi:hypothetical protein
MLRAEIEEGLAPEQLRDREGGVVVEPAVLDGDVLHVARVQRDVDQGADQDAALHDRRHGPEAAAGIARLVGAQVDLEF